MKFDQIILTGSTSITLFDLKSPRSTPYVARTIDGLGPTEVDVTLAQTSQGAGIYVGRREQLRDITINAHLNTNYLVGQTPEMLREAIYLLRPVKDDMSLDFRLMLDGNEVATTPVYVKRVEIVPFSKETTLQIVLASTSGFFHGHLTTLLDPTTSKTDPIFTNLGTVSTGFRLEVQFTGSMNEFGLRQFFPTYEFVLKKAAADPYLFTTGDLLVIDTNIGKREVKLTRAGVTTSVLGKLTQDSTWISLYPGDNQLKTLNVPTTPLVFIWKKFEHTPKYQGV